VAIARQVAGLAMGRIPAGARIADIGCGDGALLAAILEKGKPSSALGVDLSGKMLSAAAKRLSPHGSVLIQADAEALPFANGSMDMIVSSLALQWVENTGAAIMEMARALAPGGALTLATLGPGTFPELADVLSSQRIGGRGAAHTAASFAPEERLAEALRRAGFSFHIHKAMLAHQYPGFLDFIRTLKKVGALGAPVFAGMGLARRELLRRLGREYENKYRSGSGVRATYQVFFIEAERRG